MSAVYTDNQIPIGSVVVDIKRTNNGTTVGTFKCEGVTLNRPGKVINRPDELGDEDSNGWALVKGASTGSGTIQIPLSTSQVPQRGDWFEEQFDGSSAGAVERWVLTDIGQSFNMGDYYKASFSIRYSPNPPATSA